MGAVPGTFSSDEKRARHQAPSPREISVTADGRGFCSLPLPLPLPLPMFRTVPGITHTRVGGS